MSVSAWMMPRMRLALAMPSCTSVKAKIDANTGQRIMLNKPTKAISPPMSITPLWYR